ncbi:hypothetical protein MASR2M69_02610 [Bacteroidota bacterium]
MEISNGGTPYNLFTVAKDRSNPLSIKVVEFTTSTSTGITPVNEFTYTSANPVTYRREMEMVPNARYSTVYYADGNKIFAWYPKIHLLTISCQTILAITLSSWKSITTMSVVMI